LNAFYFTGLQSAAHPDRQSYKMKKKPFWETKTLEEMSDTEWESLCDGCGRCCLNKLEDWETGEIYWTDIGCELLDCETCRCRDYANRQDIVPDCIRLTPEQVRTITWLPPTCAYRRIRDGQGLNPWHPLVSGDPQSVHRAGISVRGRAVPDTGITPENYEDHLVDWPDEGWEPENSK
jgi:hypothetical protein